MEAGSRRFAGQFTISGDGTQVILGLLDEPVAVELEVVLDGPAALGAR